MTLPADLAERAAIREYLGGEPRAVAEREAELGRGSEEHTSAVLGAGGSGCKCKWCENWRNK